MDAEAPPVSLQSLRRAALLLALLVALVAPGARLLFGMQGWQATLAAESEQLADLLAGRVSANPDGWSYETNALLSELRRLAVRRPGLVGRVLDERGRSAAELGSWQDNAWLEAEAPLFDAGVPVGRVQLQMSLQPLALQVAAVALVGALLALGVWLWAQQALRAVERSLLDSAEARQEAEAANRAKSSFLATMSHEIRTPMNGVLGMAELLAHSQLTPAQSQSVQTIRESAQSLLRVIDDILDFSKIEAGRLDLERVPIALPALLESLFDALTPVAETRQVELHLFIDPAVPPWVLGDPVRLRQVLTNLLGNAIKFSAGQSERIGRVQLRVRVEAPALVFSVLDNGIGIGAEAQAQIFQPFVQAKSSTTRRFGGTGLGLAICQRLVELMQGRIALSSQPGHGACFEVRLPLPPLQGQGEPTHPDLHGTCCLLIEEGGLPVEDLAAWLRHAGSEVVLLARLAEVARPEPWKPGSVVVLRADEHTPLPDGPELCWLLVQGAGRRRVARLRNEQVALLDRLRHDALLRAVAMLVGRASPPVRRPDDLETLPSAAAQVPTAQEAQARGRLILVAEDDATNRAVIARQLAWLGHAAEIVEDGALALARWREGRFGLLLTDLHMPAMDGYELARQIREDERTRTLAHRPLLALTAGAMKGEDQRAREAGLDDYLTKPIPIRQLQAALQRWLPPLPAAGAAPGPAPSGPPSAPAAPAREGGEAPLLDLQQLRQLVGEDEVFEQELLQGFLQDGAALAQQLQQAFERGDLAALQALAHRYKSSARSVGALALAQCCEELEGAARSGERDSGQLQRFEALLARTRSAVLAVLPA